MRYRDLTKRVYYKIDDKSLITRDDDKNIDDFLKIAASDKFFEPFDYGKLEPVLKKRELISWSVNHVLYRERQISINERVKFSFPLAGDNEELTFK